MRQQAICKRYSSTGPPDGLATWSSANVSAPRSPQWVGQPSIVAVPGALYPLCAKPLFVEPRLVLLRCCMRCGHFKHLRQPLLVRLLLHDSVGMVSRCEGSLQPFRVHCALRLVKSAMHINNLVRINCSPLDLVEYLAFLICDVRQLLAFNGDAAGPRHAALVLSHLSDRLAVFFAEFSARYGPSLGILDASPSREHI